MSVSYLEAARTRPEPADVLTLVPHPALPELRLLPAPSSEPPYDDDVPAAARRLRVVPAPWSAAPAEWTVAAPAAPPAPLPGGDVVPLHALPPLDDDEDRVARTPLAQLPPPHVFARALVQRLLEVLAGLRPLAQLQRDTSLELFDELAQTLPRGRRTHAARPTARDVRGVHVQARADGVAEGCATVRQGDRYWALAFRLEGVRDAWQCTALDWV